MIDYREQLQRAFAGSESRFHIISEEITRGIHTMSELGKFSLISMPYACISRREMLSPSLPLGTLKAFLCSHGWSVEAVHAHLDFLYYIMDYSDWPFVLENFRIPVVHTYGLDMLFMSLAEETADSDPAMERLAQMMYSVGTSRRQLPFSVFTERLLALRQRLSAFFETLLSRIEIQNGALVGMSCVHGQMFAAVELARRIHRQAPDARIIFGGIDCHGKTAHLLLQAASHSWWKFPEPSRG